jgi:hypothetical protein
MQKLIIQESKSTPNIIFHDIKNVLEIKGQSYPENAAIFFQPLFDWINNNLATIKNDFIINIDLTYLNTSSAKIMINLFDILNNEYKKGKEIKINWYYDNENEISLECGEEFKKDLDLPFNLIEKKNC